MYLWSSILESSMRIICHDIYKNGYVARKRLSIRLREWKDVRCFTDYPRGETVLTEDAIAPHRTPMWECSGCLLAGTCHYIAKYGIVYTSFPLFLLAHLSCQAGLLWNWEPALCRKSGGWRISLRDSMHPAVKEGQEKSQHSQPTNSSWDIRFKNHHHKQCGLLVSMLGQHGCNGTTSVAGCCFRQE